MSASSIPTAPPPASVQDLTRKNSISFTSRQSRRSGPPSRQGTQLRSSPAQPPTDRSSAVLVRKKLPWLDGPRIPGQFDSKESLGIGEQHEGPRNPEMPLSSKTIHRPSMSADVGDPALRAVGSEPSLRKGAGGRDFHPLSLTSSPRAGVTPLNSKKAAMSAFGVPSTNRATVDDSSSLYSVSPATEVGGMKPHLQRSTSYERLLAKRSSSHTAPTSNPFTMANALLEEELDLPLNKPASPRQRVKSLQHGVGSPSSPRQKSVQVRKYSSSDSYGQRDPMSQPPVPLRTMPKAKTLPRRSIAVPTYPPPEPPPQPPRPARKPTLFAMPTHLLAASSSSSSPGDQHMAPVQAVIVPAQSRSPLPPPPPPTNGLRNDRRQSQSLNRAVTGLENLMQEALTVARDAAHSGRNDEVAGILDSATTALRRASTVNSHLRAGRMSQPLVLSPPLSTRGSDSDSSIGPHSDASSIRNERRSVDTAPTMLTKTPRSSRPTLVDQDASNWQRRRSLKASFETMDDLAASRSPDRGSMMRTPPRLYQPPSADSVVRDFAYARAKTARAEAARQLSRSHGAAEVYYGDTGESVVTQPGVRPSLSAPMMIEQPLRKSSTTARKHSMAGVNDIPPRTVRTNNAPMQQLEPAPTQSIPPRSSSRNWEKFTTPEPPTPRRRRDRPQRPPHLSDHFQSSYYRQHPTNSFQDTNATEEKDRSGPPDVEERYESNTPQHHHPHLAEFARYSDSSPNLLQRHESLRHPRRKHISLREGQGFSLGRSHRRKPIAREWGTVRKRVTASIACLNQVFVGLITGIYAGEVPRIQYQLADTTHKVILGNVVLFACLGATTLIFWPLPLLHGRKAYTLISFALMLPLMFPQAIVISSYRNPNNPLYRCGLLIPRAFQGIAMGFANINFLPTLLDLFGASLMSTQPHQEIVVYDDVRRQGGGVGIWLGIWSFCFVGSMSIGFCAGALIISTLDPSWGFYIVVILLAFFLLVNVVAPETRRAPYRRSIAQFLDGDEKIKRRVARGEVRLHISNDGPRWWFEEVWAGIILTKRMATQFGFLVMLLYLGWMYAQVTLVILLLGALLTRDYKWQPQYVGPAVLSVAIGAFLAVPLSKANLFSRARDTPQRTDSMTMQHHTHHERVHWSSHMLRRCVFTLTLPLAAIAYTLSSPGPSVSWVAPTVFCGLVGFLSNLAIAECVGIIMETFDTCDLQPGVNQKHRLQSMAETTRRRRTNYSSFPRVCAGFFAAQSTGFFLSAAATGASGDITRAVGAQLATAIVAAILLGLTVFFILVLWRWKAVQVIPNGAFGTMKGSIAWGPGVDDPEWRPVIIGNPSGKMRRMNVLELGGLSRWAEIRRLNKLLRN